MAIDAGDVVWKFRTEGAGDLSKAMDGVAQKAATIGKGMTIAGAAVTGTLTAMVAKTTQYGDTLAKSAKRTGVSVKATAEWGHVLDQGGASLETFEKALKKQSQVIFEAGQGTGTYTDTLDALGVSYEQLQGLSPEEQFDVLALALADVSDHTTQAALAQELFGRAGVDLLPTLNAGSEAINQMKQEAHELGIVMSDEQAAAAEEMADKWDEMMKSLQGVGLQIGTALMPLLTQLLGAIIPIITSVTEWMAANPELTGTITMVVGGVGALMTVLGPLLIMLPGIISAFGILSSALPVIGAGFAALTGPVGLAVAVIAGAALLIIQNWEGIKGGLEVIWDGIKAVFKGAADFVSEVFQAWVDFQVMKIEFVIEAWNKFKDAVLWVWDQIVGGIQSAADFIAGIIDGIFGIIGEVFSALRELALAAGDFLGFADGGVVPGYADGGAIKGYANGGLTDHRIVRVGERGPELVALPVGSNVMRNEDMRAAAKGGGGLNINGPLMQGVSIANDMDVDTVARQLAVKLEREMSLRSGGAGLARAAVSGA